jgi:VanZ family protein
VQVWAYWLPVLLWAGAIYYLSSLPQPDLPELFPHFDKLVHAGVYAGLAFLVARAVGVQRARVDRFTLWIAIAVASVYGLTDEWHQSYVPTRSAEVWDWAADMVGSVMGALGYAMTNHWALKQLRKSA